MEIDLYTSEGKVMLRVLKHALGADSKNPGYRNRYVVFTNTMNDFHCQRLVDLGAMVMIREEAGYRSYKVTVSGCIIAGLTVEQIEKACGN